MTISIAWGKLIIAAGAGSGVILYLGLPDLFFQSDRKVSLNASFVGGGYKEENLSNFGDRFQGFLPQSACFHKSRTFEDIFELVFRLGEAKVKNVRGNYEFDGVLGIRKKGLRLDWENAGGSGWVKEDIWDTEAFGLMAYESEGGGGLLLWTKGKPLGDEFKLTKEHKERAKSIEVPKSDILGKKIKVRRSVKGIWGEKEVDQNKCKSLEPFETTEKVIYKNYGMLQADGIPVKEIKVLDWIHWGKNEIRNSEKMVLRQQQSSRGRYDYFELDEKITKVIVGSFKEIRINEEGISSGRGERIKWSDKFKPTFIVELKK